eukprot:2290200-Prymnesium_polylepis.1
MSVSWLLPGSWAAKCPEESSRETGAETPPREPGTESSAVDPVSAWLDRVKPGYSQRFSDAFRLSGIEDLEDVAQIDDEIFAEIEGALSSAGAKVLQIKTIREAIVTAGAAGLVASPPPRAASPVRVEAPSGAASARPASPPRAPVAPALKSRCQGGGAPASPKRGKRASPTAQRSSPAAAASPGSAPSRAAVPLRRA